MFVILLTFLGWGRGIPSLHITRKNFLRGVILSVSTAAYRQGSVNLYVWLFTCLVFIKNIFLGAEQALGLNILSTYIFKSVIRFKI